MNKAIIAAISVGVFFAGFGISYALFSTYDPATMKFRSQENFDQMMSNNPKMTQNWIDTMMSDPQLRQQVIDTMMQNQEFMQSMMQNTKMMDKTSSQMTQQSMMNEMSFNVNAPITIPMIDGYYKGERVYFIHTEVSDTDMADMMSMMINFPTLHVSELKNISQENITKVYVFTNGIKGSGPYGGGPFMFQIDVFDSIPEQDGYSQFRVPHLVTWSDNSTPRLLTSVEEILEAEKNGELTIQKTDNVVNAPMIVWNTSEGTQKATEIKNIFKSMPSVVGQTMKVDEENYIVTIKMRQSSQMDMMN